MALIDVVKKKFLWIVIGTILFYILLILVSDVEKIYEFFSQIKIEFLVLIFGLILGLDLTSDLRKRVDYRRYRLS